MRRWDAETDVIVAGFGGAGACAATRPSQLARHHGPAETLGRIAAELGMPNHGHAVKRQLR